MDEYERMSNTLDGIKDAAELRGGPDHLEMIEVEEPKEMPLYI